MSSPKPGSTARGAAHGGARRGCVAGRDGTGLDGTPAGRFAQGTTVAFAPRAPKTNVLDDSSEARSKEIRCKANGATQRPVEGRFFIGAATILRSKVAVGRHLFPDTLGMRRVCRDKKHQSTIGHPGTKSAFRPVDKPLKNR